MAEISNKFELFVGAMGNILVWYCFALFMPFLHVLSRDFFPIGDSFTVSVVSFLVVGVGLFFRPIGAAIFGPIGDKIGRQKALSLSILFMAVPTFCVGLLPDYHRIGIFAPVILIILRLFQGISMGGEFTTAMVRLVELSPSNRRGLFGTFSDVGAQVGVMLASFSLLELYSCFSEEQIYEYAWRYPFFGAALLIPFAFVHPSRKNDIKPAAKRSVFGGLLEHKKEVLCTFAVTAFSAVSFYTLFTFLPYFLVRENVLTLKMSTQCVTYANCAVMFFAVLGGYLSDKFRRKPFLGCGMIGVASTVCFIFLVGIKSESGWILVHMIFGLFIGMYFSGRAAFFSETFPKSIRCTGVSMSMSLAQAIFGGSITVIMNQCTAISNVASVLPIIFVTTCGIIALTQMPDRTGAELM